ncbi:MAG: alpha/beta hydrolase [Clostridia bacterium]|nr:alpha/beta hydrolase [Clostridia bacterium]
MLNEKIYLFEGNDEVFLETYCADKIWDKKRDAILVIPGGGYGGVCADREGEPIALSYLGKGVNAFVLTYSTGKSAAFPKVLIEASMAMKHIKDNAEKYNIDPKRVFVTGFSAGGHLCTCLGTLWHLPEVQEAVDMEFGYNKPAGIIPVYPVITPFTPNAHVGSFRNLFHSENPSVSDLESVALNTKVDENSSPAFIVHTSDDQIVPVHNSLALAQSYALKGMKFELHIYPSAPHGVALGNDITSLGKDSYVNKSIEGWIDLSIEWMKQI